MSRLLLPVLAGAGLAAQSPQFQVVPAAWQTLDAGAHEWVAGANQDLRQQTLIGSSHLQALVGHDLFALELRRNAADETYTGGQAQMTVSLSTSPAAPLACSAAFAANAGSDQVTVFTGSVTIPTSPAVAGNTVPWTAANVVHIAFQQPFHYAGGTLCVDLLGTALPGQTAGWWVADAVFEDLTGTVTRVGSGCGLYGGPGGAWSDIAARSLLPGARAHYWAYGPAGGFGVAAFGAASPVPLSMVPFGFPAACTLRLQPASVLAAVVVPFAAPANALLAARGGVGEVWLSIPNQPWTFGWTLTTQWLDFSQPATSDALQWSVAPALPTLDMALLEGLPGQPRGELSVHLAHVFRFEYR